eukprot:comp15964_c0_seq1/m.13376 comp15964_c0_seq1/g.13376  ORF comp15964_c0_seq1/g.13376 comp15964_c0_seq1/m.13376 type:complete len:477 (-) comp15964_c0_seq1:63-1493(-)
MGLAKMLSTVKYLCLLSLFATAHTAPSQIDSPTSDQEHVVGPRLPRSMEGYRNQMVVQVMGVDKTNVNVLRKHVQEILQERYAAGGTTVRASSQQIKELQKAGFETVVLVNDLGTFLATHTETAVPNARAMDVGTTAINPDAWYTQYHPAAEIDAHQAGLVAVHSARTNPGWVLRRSIGKTWLGKDIYATELGSPTAPNVIYVQAGLHAREWIASASTTYTLVQMLKALPNKGAITTTFFTTFRLVFVPLVNVDGYEYSRTKDRLWRKNVRQYANVRCQVNTPGADPTVIGVDLNRNFNGFNSWEKDTDYCYETHGGITAFSEPETAAVAKYLAELKTKYRVVSALDLHSFGQVMLYPYGYDYNLPKAPNEANHIAVANLMRAAMYSTSRASYTAETSAGFYPCAGCADDYFYDKVATAPMGGNKGIVFTIELSPVGFNPVGFVLPPTQILPVGKGVNASLLALIRYLQPIVAKKI